MKKQSVKHFSVVLSVLLAAVLLASQAAAFTYEHNPLDNPRAMEDIVVNPDAVYGFSPNPASTRLGVYADAIDWTDPDQVAQAKAEREAYHAKNAELYAIIAEGIQNGESTEEIARKVSQRRNELRLESYKDNPAGLELAKQSNLETYGSEFGPTPEWLINKYGSWQIVIEKSCSSNAGMDACLGLYDEMYYTYALEDAPEQLTEPQETTESAPVATPVPSAAKAVSSEPQTPPTGESEAALSMAAVFALALCACIASGRKRKVK